MDNDLVKTVWFCFTYIAKKIEVSLAPLSFQYRKRFRELLWEKLR